MVVVDVEDNDYTAFRNLTPHDGGLGGWRLLWERINPFGSWLGRWFLGPSIDEASPASGGGGGGGSGGNRNGDRTVTAVTAVTAAAPSYASLLNALTTAASSRHLAQARKEHAVNLYLRPPGVSGWVAPLTPNRVDALVRRAHRYACGAIADWQRAASAERVRDANAARAEAQDLAESRGAFHLGSPVPQGSSAGDTGVATPSVGDEGVANPSAARGDDDLLAAARGARGERRERGNRTSEGNRVRWDDSGRLRKGSRCTSEPAGARYDRRGRRRGARRPEGSARRSRPSPRAPGLAPEGVGTGLVRWSLSVAMLPLQQQLRHRGVHARPQSRLVLRVHRPPPRRGVRAPNDDDDDRYKSRYEDVRRPEVWGEKSVVVETGSARTGRVGVGARRASGRDRERRDRPAGADDDGPAASQERAGADAPAVAPLLHDAPEERRGGETRRAQAALGRRAGVCRSHGHPTRVEPGGNDRDAAKDSARSAGDDAAGGQASGEWLPVALGRVGRGRV